LKQTAAANRRSAPHPPPTSEPPTPSTSPPRHLATSAEHRVTEIYSNDKHPITAAPFGLAGVNAIP